MAIAVLEALVVNRLVNLSSTLTNKRSCVRKYSTLLSSRWGRGGGRGPYTMPKKRPRTWGVVGRGGVLAPLPRCLLL